MEESTLQALSIGLFFNLHVSSHVEEQICLWAGVVLKEGDQLVMSGLDLQES